MAEATDLQLSITANVNGLKAGLTQATTSVRGAAQSMRTELGRATDGATQGFGGLSGAVRAYGREQREQARNTRLFANEITSILPASNQAAQGLAGVAASLIGGFGLLAAFDLLKVGIQMYRDHQAKALEEAKKFAKDGLDAITEAANRAKGAIGDVWGSMGGAPASANVGRAQLAYMKRQRAGLQSKLDGTEDEDQRKELEKAIGDADKEIVQLELAIPGAAFRDRVKFEEEQRRKAEEAKRKLEAATKKAAEERAKLEAVLAGGRPMEQKPLGLDQWAEAEASKNGAAAREQVAKGQGATNFGGVFAGGAGYSDESVFGKFAYEAKLAQEETAKLKEEMAGLQEAAGSIGSAAAAGLADLVTGAKSAGQVIRSVAASVIQSVLQLAMKQITANAMVSGSEAMKSQAGIPIVGPALGAAAMASIIAMVMALTSKLPSAAGGWLIPKGLDPVVQAHGGERIIPARYAEGLDRLVNGGGAAPIFNITTMDAKSFEQALSDHDSSLFKVLNRGIRDRRFG